MHFPQSQKSSLWYQEQPYHARSRVLGNPDLFRHVMLSARGGLDAEDQEQRSR